MTESLRRTSTSGLHYGWRKWRRGLTTFDVAGVIALVSFAFFMLQLSQRSGGPVGETTLEVTADEAAAGFREGVLWHGLYRDDDKIGFLRERRERTDVGYRLEHWQVMNLSFLGRSQRIEVRVDTYYDQYFVLLSFEADLETADSTFSIEGTARPQDLGDPGLAGFEFEPNRGANAEPEPPSAPYQIDFLLTTLGTETENTLLLDEPPRVEGDLQRALLAQNPEVGDSFESLSFDPLTQSERRVVLIYDGRQDITVLGETVSAHRILTQMGQQQLQGWVNDLGEVLRQELPLGLTAVRESRAEAMYGVVRPDEQAQLERDFARTAAIQVTGLMPNLGTNTDIRWVLTGVDPARFDVHGGRQSLVAASAVETPNRETISDEVRSIVDVTLETWPSTMAIGQMAVEASENAHDLRAALAATMLIQSDAPLIIGRAQQIGAGQRTAAEAADAVTTWLGDFMTQTTVVGVPSALDILQRPRGDCNEHATLAVAMLRALDVPAVIVSGLAYRDEAFYYHAWVEYWDGLNWRTTDPTWGQHPADLGHIRLVSGGLDRQASLFELFGRIRVEALR